MGWGLEGLDDGVLFYHKRLGIFQLEGAQILHEKVSNATPLAIVPETDILFGGLEG